MINQQQSSASPALSFPSESSLSDFLKSRIPPDTLSSWGTTPGTKTTRNLFLEITQGESSLTATPTTLLRTVNVAALQIKNSRGLTLVESQQLLSDARTRSRNLPLSEKMKPGESIYDAAVRAVKEELGGKIFDEGVEVLMDSYRVEVDEEKGSNSYPGLPSRYVLHQVEVIVKGIYEEDGEFCTDEEGEGHEADNGAVVVKKHFWKWVPLNDGIDGTNACCDAKHA